MPKHGPSMIKKLTASLLSLFILISTFLFVALILGEEEERKVWAETPSTLHLYTTDEVCEHESGQILNCGHCGSCSNLHDINIYREKKTTLTGIMTDCARGDLLFDRDAFECLRAQAGMTDDCTKCWVLNYECNIQHCVRTCIKHRFFPFLPSIHSWNSDPVDPCYACDEKLCGPIFVGCAGANRRRVGIVSDIERRTNREICDKVDWDWVVNSGSITNRHSKINAAKEAEL